MDPKLNGQIGLVPAAYIRIEEELDLPPEEAPELVQALYDYQARSEFELSMYAGAIIQITSKECSEGWWEGMLDGKVGQFPQSYVQPYYYEVESMIQID